MKDKLTIVHVDCGREWGGGQAQVYMLLDGLRAAGNRNILLCRSGCPLGQRASEEGIASVAKATFGTVTMPRVVGILQRVLEVEQPDLLHLHDSRAHSIGALFAARVPDRPKIIVSRRVAFRSQPGTFSKWKYRHGADRYIAISQAAAETILLHGISKDKISVIPSCYAVEPDMRRKGTGNFKSGLGLPPDTFLIGTIGSLSRIKGHGILIDALTGLLKDHPEIALVIAGDGPQKGSLKKRIKELNLESRVHLLGFIEDLTPVYSDLDMFVIPSLAEGLNTSLLQAMAWEIPCVASDVGGVPEAIENQQEGLLVPPDDVEALQSAMRQLLQQPQWADTLAQAAREKATARFSKSHMVNGTEGVYRAVLEE